jgi:hypothetical protein
MSYYPPSIRPNGFIQTEKKTTKITKKQKNGYDRLGTYNCNFYVDMEGVKRRRK